MVTDNKTCIVMVYDDSEAVLAIRTVLDRYYRRKYECAVSGLNEHLKLEPHQDVVFLLVLRKPENALHSWDIIKNHIEQVKNIRYKTLLVCEKQYAAEAFDLCINKVFDDYCAGYPIYDIKHLLLSVIKLSGTISAFNDQLNELAAPSTDATVQPPGAEKADVVAFAPPAPVLRKFDPNDPSTISIMIADDQKVMRQIISTTLTPRGYKLYEAVDGQDVLERVKLLMPCLILLDIDMPEMNGIEALAALKKMDVIRDIPVIMLTSSADSDHVRQCMALGARDYIVKPTSASIMFAKIDKTLGLGGSV